MCERDETALRKGANTGAMEALLKVPRTKVISSYTEMPLLYPEGASGVCHYPAKLSLDGHERS